MISENTWSNGEVTSGAISPDGVLLANIPVNMFAILTVSCVTLRSEDTAHAVASYAPFGVVCGNVSYVYLVSCHVKMAFGLPRSSDSAVA